MRLLGLISGFQSGAYNMALDETLLEWVRQESAPTLVVRTYQWRRPTLSLGVHQPHRDLAALTRLYPTDVYGWVRRPTGGRAILHGEDIAFSFITNDPALLRQSLNNSYCHFSTLLKAALARLNVPLQESGEDSDTAYLRSSLCFETQTPSDLLDARGQKIAGSAQLRRQGGLLQHGSAFVKSYQIDEPTLANALFDATGVFYQQPVTPLQLDTAQLSLLGNLLEAYQREEGPLVKSSDQSSLDNASTTSGSHLEPASF